MDGDLFHKFLVRLCSFTVLFSPCRPLLATSREEVGPTAVWLDGTTSRVWGGEEYSAYVGRWVGQGESSTSGDAVGKLEGACKERGVGMAISNFNTCTNTQSNTHTHTSIGCSGRAGLSYSR